MRLLCLRGRGGAVQLVGRHCAGARDIGNKTYTVVRKELMARTQDRCC
jgi:hypothetical protein